MKIVFVLKNTFRTYNICESNKTQIKKLRTLYSASDHAFTHSFFGVFSVNNLISSWMKTKDTQAIPCDSEYKTQNAVLPARQMLANIESYHTEGLASAGLLSLIPHHLANSLTGCSTSQYHYLHSTIHNTDNPLEPEQCRLSSEK